MCFRKSVALECEKIKIFFPQQKVFQGADHDYLTFHMFVLGDKRVVKNRNAKRRLVSLIFVSIFIRYLVVWLKIMIWALSEQSLFLDSHVLLIICAAIVVEWWTDFVSKKLNISWLWKFVRTCTSPVSCYLLNELI